MRRSSTWSATCLIAFAAIALGVRMGGAHLHVCADGLEAPTSLHIADDCTDHVGPHAGSPHDDRDVSLAGDFLAKKLQGGAFDGDPAALGSLAGAVVRPLVRILGTASPAGPPLVAAHFLRPQGRAPPRQNLNL